MIDLFVYTGIKRNVIFYDTIEKLLIVSDYHIIEMIDY